MPATINGILEEKSKISKIKIIHCKCRSAYFYDKRAPEYCPKCGSRLSLNNEVVEDVRTPDSKIIFKINRDAAVHALTNYVSKKKFVSKDFIAAIKESELDLKPVYVPCWEWTIQANGQFKVVFSTPQKTDEKDEKGNNIIRQVEHESVQNASFPEKTILVPSSRIIDSKVVELGNRVSEVFSFENCPSATAFELYSKNKKESLQDARNSVISDLEKEATKRHGDEIYVRTSEKKVDFVKESCTLVMSPVWNGTFNYNHLFQYIKDDIKKADLAIVDQETIFETNKTNFVKKLSNTPTELGDAIVNAGFKVVLHGTLYSFIKAEKGIINTLNI